jgi:branched-chain amino acid transport system permease protein
VQAQLETIVFGALLVVLLQVAPGGLWPRLMALLPRRASDRKAVDMSAAALPVREKAPDGEGALLDVRQARKQFGGVVAVNNVSFDVHAREIVALIGPNGAGKSTMFNLITGVLPANGGEISTHGTRIDGASPQTIVRLGIARTFQHVKLIPDMTVLENVALGAHLRGRHGVAAAMLRVDRSEEKRLLREAERQLARIGMADRMHELAGNLALGPQRLMEIARALAADPTLLLLDEPAAGLRLKEKQALAEVLRTLRNEGMAILLVEHDMDLVMGLVDRVVVMEFGTKLIEGTPEEVQASPAVRAAYLGTEH